jgi:hypothetical protein
MQSRPDSRKTGDIVINENEINNLYINNTNQIFKDVIDQLENDEGLPEIPNEAINCFCVTLFCIAEAVNSCVNEFIYKAFDLFPERDYMIMTQPHTVPENALLNKFILATKKPHNTFSHVL